MILYGNRLLPKEQVSISPEDRGYYFGDGIYEVFRVYGGRLYETEAHFRRLSRSLEAVRIPLPYPLPELETLLEELVRENRIGTGTVYVQITRGEAPRAHAFPKRGHPVVYGYASEMPRPVAALENGIRAITVEDIRWLRCDVKSLNLLGNVLAKQDAIERGADDAILHRGGTVTEASAANVMIVKDGRLATHPANHLILPGITREVVLRLAREIGIPADERPFTLEEMRQADEVCITSTTMEVVPVVEIDGRAVRDGKPGPAVRRLQEAFAGTIGE